MHVVLTVLECKRKMTEQYPPTNINGPRLPRRDVVGDIQLNLDDEFVVITAGDPNITLPNARVIPSRQIYIKSETGTGTVLALPGQLIDGAPSFSFGVASESRLFKSDGLNWKLVSGLGGGGAGTDLEIEDEGVLVTPSATLLNFVGAGVSATLTGPGLVDVTIPGGDTIPSGPDIPEGVVAGTPGSIYIRESAGLSSFWQYAGAAPGNTGWIALGPFRTGTPVGAVDGVNASFSFPGASEAVSQGADSLQIKYTLNGITQTEGVDYTTTAGAVPGTTISSFSVITTLPPQVGDVLRVTFVPA